MRNRWYFVKTCVVRSRGTAAPRIIENVSIESGSRDLEGLDKLANLIAYGDQSRIHDALAEGAVDAFAVDHPIFHWACTAPDSRWHGRIEILPGNIAPAPWHYAVGVKAEPASYRLLAKVNEFIGWFHDQPERLAIERAWQGNPLNGTRSYRDEPGQLLGEPELRELYRRHQAFLGPSETAA